MLYTDDVLNFSDTRKLCVLHEANGAVTYKRIKVTDAERTENLQKMFIR